MSSRTITTCDFCGTVKGGTRWWKLMINADGGLVVSAWGVIRIGLDACGSVCVSKAVARWLATGSLEEKKAE